MAKSKAKTVRHAKKAKKKVRRAQTTKKKPQLVAKAARAKKATIQEQPVTAVATKPTPAPTRRHSWPYRTLANVPLAMMDAWFSAVTPGRFGSNR